MRARGVRVSHRRSIALTSYVLAFTIALFALRKWIGHSRTDVWTKSSTTTPNRGPIEAQEVKVTSCGNLLCSVERVARKGLLLTAYSTDESLLRRKFLPEAAQLARSFKKFNSFPVCIVTNANVTEFGVDGAFDYLIPVGSPNLIDGEERSGGYEPQWFTRLVHLSASPFRVTLTLDSDAGFCGRIDGPFKELEGFDFVVSNRVKDHVPGCTGEYPHNFMMGYVLSVNTKILFSNWLRSQKKVGKAIDDQGPLMIALRDTRKQLGSKFKLGFFSTAFGASLMHHNDVDFSNFLPATTKVLSTFVPIVHPVQGFGLTTSHFELTRALDAMCEKVNHSPSTVRMLVKTSYDVGGLHIVYTDEECAIRIGEPTCAGRLNDENRTVCGFNHATGHGVFNSVVGRSLNAEAINAAVSVR